MRTNGEIKNIVAQNWGFDNYREANLDGPMIDEIITETRSDVLKEIMELREQRDRDMEMIVNLQSTIDAYGKED